MPGLQNILLLCHDKATKFLSIIEILLRKLLCTYSAIILLIKLHIEDEAKMLKVTIVIILYNSSAIPPHSNQNHAGI